MVVCFSFEQVRKTLFFFKLSLFINNTSIKTYTLDKVIFFFLFDDNVDYYLNGTLHFLKLRKGKNRFPKTRIIITVD